MKKILLLVLALALVVSLAACGEKDNTGSTGGNSNTPGTSQGGTSSTTPTPSENNGGNGNALKLPSSSQFESYKLNASLPSVQGILAQSECDTNALYLNWAGSDESSHQLLVTYLNNLGWTEESAEDNATFKLYVAVKDGYQTTITFWKADFNNNTAGTLELFAVNAG
jgi:hypothetical protein